MVKIAPSIASADQANLRKAVEDADEGGADLIHFAIEDGVFIPNLSFGPMTIRNLRSFSSLPFDVHLQVSNPEQYLEHVIEAGADIVTLQVESTHFPYRAIYVLRQLGVKAGLAFTAASPLDMLPPILDHLDVVHLMTAEPNGSADHFIEGLLGKIQSARALIGSRNIEIEVDGGIGFQNAAEVVRAGASILVAGRAVWNEPDPRVAIVKLRLAGDT